jgi:hypothetical protein
MHRVLWHVARVQFKRIPVFRENMPGQMRRAASASKPSALLSMRSAAWRPAHAQVHQCELRHAAWLARQQAELERAAAEEGARRAAAEEEDRARKAARHQVLELGSLFGLIISCLI